MSTARAFAPDEATRSYGERTLPQLRMSPGAVGGLTGPGNVGPEQAGALSLVYGSFAAPEDAQRGYRLFTDAQRSLLEAPGFLRWLTFVDGPHGFALGWWRSADDAATYARDRAHREFVRAQRETPFELSQFAGIWTAHQIGRRTFSCPRCKRTTVATRTECECGEQLDDGFAPTPR